MLLPARVRVIRERRIDHVSTNGIGRHSGGKSFNLMAEPTKRALELAATAKRYELQWTDRELTIVYGTRPKPSHIVPENPAMLPTPVDATQDHESP